MSRRASYRRNDEARPAKRAKRNSGLRGYRPRTPRERQVVGDLAKRYQDFHWGAKPRKLIHVDDPLVPDIVQVGTLQQVYVDGVPLDFPKGTQLAWDPKHPLDRLHIVLPKKERERNRQAMKEMQDRMQPLSEIAQRAGGAHARKRYPSLRGVALGRATDIVYHTTKVGDGPSDYIHKFAEEHGSTPILAVDASGRIWLLGGDYRVVDAGIVN